MRAHKHLHEPSGKVEDDLDLPSCKGKIRTIRECHDRECVIELLNRKRKVFFFVGGKRIRNQSGKSNSPALRGRMLKTRVDVRAW